MADIAKISAAILTDCYIQGQGVGEAGEKRDRVSTFDISETGLSEIGYSEKGNIEKGDRQLFKKKVACPLFLWNVITSD